MDQPNRNSVNISENFISYLRNERNNPDIEYREPLTRLQGGYETSIYRFKLKGAGEDFSRFLVLRLYPQFYGIRNAIWESRIQNLLVGVGYPAARVHFICTDMSVLGGAFFVMDYIPGQPLMFTAAETTPDILGKTHADLHKIDPARLINPLKEQGVDEHSISLHPRYDWLKNKVGELPWIREGVNWLFDNRPPEPQHLSVCHGDFHALNIMVKDGAVTGVLDWAGFAIADPVYDVANTVVLTTIPARHLVGAMEGFSSIDWDLAARLYLSAYQTHLALDTTYLDYYKARRCLMSLIQGVEGQKVWQHPGIVHDLILEIKRVTGIRITVPG